MKRPFDRDRMAMVAPGRVAEASMDILNSMQVRFTPEEQITAAAAVFVILADRFNVEAQDAFTVTKRVINAVDGVRPEFRAVQHYARNEL